MGDKPMEERMAVMEVRADAIEDDVVEIKDTLKWANRLTFGTLVSALVTMALVLLKG